MPPKYKKGKGKGKKTRSTVGKDAVIEHEEVEDSPHSDDDTERSRIMSRNSEKTEEKLSRDEEQTLADWFGTKPEFWDNSAEHYKNKTAKDRLLTSKAVEMGKTRAELDKWFRTQRTMYGRIKKTAKSGSEATSMTGRQKWVHSNLKYLASHVVVRTATSTLGVIPSYEANCSDDGSDMGSSNAGETATTTASQPSTSTITDKSGKRVGKGVLDDVILELAKSTRDRSKKLDEEVQAPPADTIHSYTTWLASELRDLPADSFERFQRKCTMLLWDIKDTMVSSDKI
jgi:hypothetical protein